MKKLLMSSLIFVVSLALVVILGSSCVQDLVTPAFVDPNAIVYSGEEPTSFLPWTTLWDLNRIERAMDFRHQINQVALIRFIEDDDMRYAYLKDVVIVGKQNAQQLRKAIFSPSGSIGLLGTTILGGTLGAILIPKPGTKEKLEKAKEEGRKEANGNKG